jgi:integrase/recombinase XerD
MLKLLYLSGMRVSELCRLAWRDVQSDTNGVYITVFGKGGKTRTILLDNHIYKDLVFIRDNGGPDDPVFRSHKGSFLDPSQVWRIVRSAAKRAGIGVDVSPHWFRHAHASHALERGCPIHLVQATLGHASVATTGRYLHARPNDSSSLYLIA